MLNLSRLTTIVAGVGGGLWTAKALIITALDDSFGLLESIFFVGGLLLLALAAVLVARDLVDRRGVTGVLATAGAAVGLLAATSLLLSGGQALVGAVAAGDNLGLEEEGGVLLAGLAWVVVAVRARRTPAAPARRLGSAAA